MNGTHRKNEKKTRGMSRNYKYMVICSPEPIIRIDARAKRQSRRMPHTPPPAM
jgi:hypothetical protein